MPTTEATRGTEGRVRVASSSSSSSPKAGKGIHKDKSTSPRDRRHRAGKVSKPAQVKQKNEPTSGISPEAKAKTGDVAGGEQLQSHSTVVNVDSVRDKEGDEQTEESIGLLEWETQEEGLKLRTMGVCECLLIGMALVIIILFFPLSIWLCLTIVRQHERVMIFRLGHLLERKSRGPGLLFYIPFMDVCQKVDIRLKMLKVPPHTVVTKDLVSTELSAVCYYRVENVSLCFSALSGISCTLQALCQVTNREVLARHTFTEILLDRKDTANKIQVALDAVTCKWGIKVERAELEDVRLPAELQHSVTAEAEAKRLAQIKLIAAEGERAACEALKASLDALSGSPAAIQLRLLQLLSTLRTQHPAVVLTLPPDLMTLPAEVSACLDLARHSAPAEEPTSKTIRDSPMM